MSLVLLVGVGPMPGPSVERVYAPGLRLRAWANALLDEGHKVHISEFSFGGAREGFQQTDDRRVAAHQPLPPELPAAVTRLTEWVERLKPDCVVALTDIGALAATMTPYHGPIYVDYNGPPMIERQQQAFSFGNDGGLLDQWLHLLPVLLRGDRFATCSAAQRLTLLGELGAVGRLNQYTCGRDLVDVIQPNIPFGKLPASELARETMERHGIPRGAPVVLSSGGFNTWFDEETLFAGLDAALSENPALHFVCTGGAIKGHVEHVYKRFEERIAASTHRDRCHLLGWVPHGELLEIFSAADVAVNCDLWSLEVETGFRNRLLGWAWSGLRLVSTALGAPSQKLVEMGLLRSFPPGNGELMGKLILEEAAKGRRGDLKEVQAALSREFSGAKDFEPLLEWVKNPVRAPDLEAGGINSLLDYHIESRRHHLEVGEGSSPRLIARQAGESLLGSRFFRMATRVNPDLGKIAERLRSL